MASKALDNLVTVNKLVKEPGAQAEIDGLCQSGGRRLQDAENTALSLESRFDLAYSAAFALARAALRFRGYRSEDRYTVFQVLPHTLGTPNEHWRILDNAHRKRHASEYDGVFDVDTALVDGVIRVARELEKAVRDLGPVPPAS